ncbi:hypothetical protein ACVBEH_05350 [Roseateles sp. GG27B]
MPLLKEFGLAGDRLCMGHVDGRLVAAVIVRRVGQGRWISAQPSQLPLGPVLIRPELLLDEVCASLLRALPEFKLSLALTQLDTAQIKRPTQRLVLTRWTTSIPLGSKSTVSLRITGRRVARTCASNAANSRPTARPCACKSSERLNRWPGFE